MKKNKVRVKSIAPTTRAASDDDAVLSGLSISLVFFLQEKFDFSKVSLKDLDTLEREFKFKIKAALRENNY